MKKRTPSPQNQEHDQEFIDLLKRLESHKVAYPSELLAARRADFIAQVKQAHAEKTTQVSASNGHFTKRLKELKSIKAEYPAELLAARRAAFIAQVEEHSAVQVTEEIALKDQELLRLFTAIKAAEADVQYHPKLMAARRSAFRRQIALGGGTSLLETLRASLRKLFQFKVNLPSIPRASLMRTSLIIAVLMVAAFATSLLRNREPVLSPAPTQGQVSQAAPISSLTSTGEAAKVICKSGYEPPLCLAKEFDKSRDLTYQGNGAARPAVAKDTLPGYDGVHKSAYVNDGLYGPGASWISNSPYSWIKIDLGKSTIINTVTFGRDRLGNFNDRDPGQFVIAVALSDDVYEDGNSNNDYMEYTQVYNSKLTGFDGVVSGAETIRASFSPVQARFVKITFTNPGAAVDEVEVFMAQPSGFSNTPTRRPREDPPGSVSTPVPVYNTPLPTDTALPPPTNPPATDTPLPPPTKTPRPPTSTPVPTDPPPTDIPPTDVPPTDVPPTDIPPTDIPTDVPPADTPILLAPADTSQPTAEIATPVGGS
jgi:hypothetical protein